MRPSPRAVFGAATAATHVLAAVADMGWPVDRAVLDAIEDIRRFARGDGVTAAACKRLAKQLYAEAERWRGWRVGTAQQRYYWAVTAAGSLALNAATGGSLANAFEQMTCGLTDRYERVAEWAREGERAAPEVSATPARAPKVPAAKAAAEAKALARIATALGSRGRLVKAARARHEARKTADAGTLRALLARHRYPVHRSVLAFERAFGGLVIPDSGDDDEDMATIVGAFACLKSKAHVHPTGDRDGLVPVAYTANDGILFLDARGAPYYQDTIEDPRAVGLRTDAAGAVAKLLKQA
jgi:hypothetical protein